MKNRSVGVTFFGVCVIFFAFSLMGDVIEVIKYDIRYSAGNMVSILTYLGWIIVAFFLINLISGIFSLKNWARLMCIWGSVLFSAWGIVCFYTSLNPLRFVGLGEIGYLIYSIEAFVPTMIFLTRPKVKKQFE